MTLLGALAARPAQSASLAILLMITLPGVGAGQTFEGSVRQRVTRLGPEQIARVTGAPAGTRPDPEALFGAAPATLAANNQASAETTISFRDAQIRIDPPLSAAMGMEGFYALIDGGSGQMRLVVPTLRRVLIVPPSLVERLVTGLVGRGATSIGGDPDFRGRELGPATIGGIETTGFEGTSGETIVRAWMAPRHASAAAAMTLVTAALPGVPAPGQGMIGFPTGRGLVMRSGILAPVPEGAVEMVGHGWAFTAIEVISVEEKRLDPELFAMPEGFEISEMAIPR